MKDEPCNSEDSSAKPSGRLSNRWWSSSWPGTLSAHGGRHWRQSASCLGSYLPGLILSAWERVTYSSINILHLVNNLTPSRGWSLWGNIFPALPSWTHASLSSAEHFSLWILALGQIDYMTALSWMSSKEFLKKGNINVVEIWYWYPPIQVLAEQYVSMSLKTINGWRIQKLQKLMNG